MDPRLAVTDNTNCSDAAELLNLKSTTYTTYAIIVNWLELLSITLYLHCELKTKKVSHHDSFTLMFDTSQCSDRAQHKNSDFKAVHAV